MALKKKEIIAAVAEAAAKEAERFGLEIWDVEYVKEGPAYVLRIYIDKPGGVFISDCEDLSRAVDPFIDSLDMPDDDYTFEVSSPGLGRNLRTDAHLSKYMGEPVRVRLIRPDETGEREFIGPLRRFDRETVTLAAESGEKTLYRSAAAFIKLMDDQDLEVISDEH